MESCPGRLHHRRRENDRDLPGQRPARSRTPLPPHLEKLELAAELIDAAALEKYFADLAASAPDGAKSKILFTRAAFISEKDPARALEEMNQAYDAALVYAPSDLDLYGLALLGSGQADQAKAVFEKSPPITQTPPDRNPPPRHPPSKKPKPFPSSASAASRRNKKTSPAPAPSSKN